MPNPVKDLGVIDKFVETFSTYIDSGFGLLGGEVQYLTAIIIGIDITLAGLYWAMGSDSSVIGKFLKKVMYVGVFALIITNFSGLSQIIFNSFGGLGLQATNTSISAADLLRPGFIANTGFQAAHPLLTEIGNLTGPVKFFTNIVLICILGLAWVITIFAFFFLAIQLFVTVIEFKLTTLAGFILIPFALWNKTSFLAEKVLGNVVASGIKLMVLAIIIGIGSTMFGDITSAFQVPIDPTTGNKLPAPPIELGGRRGSDFSFDGSTGFGFIRSGYCDWPCFGRAAIRSWCCCRHNGRRRCRRTRWWGRRRRRRKRRNLRRNKLSQSRRFYGWRLESRVRSWQNGGWQ